MAAREFGDVREVVAEIKIGVGEMLQPERKRGIAHAAPAMDDPCARKQRGDEIQIAEIEWILVDVVARRRIVPAHLLGYEPAAVANAARSPSRLCSASRARMWLIQCSSPRTRTCAWRASNSAISVVP